MERGLAHETSSVIDTTLLASVPDKVLNDPRRDVMGMATLQITV